MAPKKRRTKTADEDASQATYIDRRDERIRYYYFVRRVTKPPAIYDFLRKECRECLEPDTGSVHEQFAQHKFEPLISANRASGLRTVQAVVMRLRQEAEPEEVLALRRPVETEKVRKTYEYLLQKQLEVIEDNSMIKVQKVAPSGEVVTVLEPRSSRLDKGKAVKAAMVLAEKIGKLTGAVLVAPADADPPGSGDGEHSDHAPAVEPYTFAFTHAATGTAADLDDMIAMNLGPSKVN